MENNVMLVLANPMDELNLLDDFLMYSMAASRKYGVSFCREVLYTIIGRKLSDVTIAAQKVFYGNNPEKHGTRLDVYVEEHADGTQTGANASNASNDQLKKIQGMVKEIWTIMDLLKHL